MTLGFAGLLWLLAGTAGHSGTVPSHFAPPPPAASVTLLVDSQTHAVDVLEQTNVVIKILPAEAQDLKITEAFDIECFLETARRLTTVSAYADRKGNLIPIDFVAYKVGDPSYVKLQIDEIYLTNKIDHSDLGTHKVRIDFYVHD